MHIIPTLKHASRLILVALTLLTVRTASADDLTSDARHALQQLVAQNPAAAKVKSRAVAVLVFPDVVKAGFIFGAQGAKEFFSSTANLMAAIGPLPPLTDYKRVSKNTGTPSSS